MVEQRRAQQRAGLAAEIVADEENVDCVGRGVEDSPVDRRVEVHDALEHRLHQVRLVVHLQVKVLHAQEVDGVVPERRPVAAEDGVLPLPCQGLGADAGDVDPVRVGPGIVVDLGSVACASGWLSGWP